MPRKSEDSFVNTLLAQHAPPQGWQAPAETADDSQTVSDFSSLLKPEMTLRELAILWQGAMIAGALGQTGTGHRKLGRALCDWARANGIGKIHPSDFKRMELEKESAKPKPKSKKVATKK